VIALQSSYRVWMLRLGRSPVSTPMGSRYENGGRVSKEQGQDSGCAATALGQVQEAEGLESRRES